MKVGDIVVNEYGNLGEITEINGNEAVVMVCNYGIENDYDYCDIRKCKVEDDPGTMLRLHTKYILDNYLRKD